MIGELRRRFRLLTPAARGRWITLAPLGLLTALLAGLGGALVFALLSVVLVPPAAVEGRLLQFLRARVPASDPRSAALHRLTTVERCDRVLLLSEGQLAATGTYAELAADNSAFRAMAALSSTLVNSQLPNSQFPRNQFGSWELWSWELTRTLLTADQSSSCAWPA